MNEHVIEVMSGTPISVLEEDDRVTARLDVYHEQFGEPPTHFSVVSSELIPQGEERVYSRKMKVSEDWTPLDTGWINNVGFILIHNIKKKYQIQPDEKEIESEKKKTIRIRSEGGEGWTIKNGSFFFGKPSDIRRVEIKCEFETTTVELNIFPE